MEFSFDPQPDFLMDILRVGGLKPYTRQRLVSMGWGGQVGKTFAEKLLAR